MRHGLSLAFIFFFFIAIKESFSEKTDCVEPQCCPTREIVCEEKDPHEFHPVCEELVKIKLKRKPPKAPEKCVKKCPRRKIRNQCKFFTRKPKPKVPKTKPCIVRKPKPKPCPEVKPLVAHMIQEEVPEVFPEVVPEVFPEVVPENVPEVAPEVIPEVTPEEEKCTDLNPCQEVKTSVQKVIHDRMKKPLDFVPLSVQRTEKTKTRVPEVKILNQLQPRPEKLHIVVKQKTEESKKLFPRTEPFAKENIKVTPSITSEESQNNIWGSDSFLGIKKKYGNSDKIVYEVQMPSLSRTVRKSKKFFDLFTDEMSYIVSKIKDSRLKQREKLCKN